MTERVWCPYCEKAKPDDHDASRCHNCGAFFCDSQGDVQLGICESCAVELAKKQGQDADDPIVGGMDHYGSLS